MHVVFLSAMAFGTSAIADPIHLVCGGAGTANKAQTSSMQGKDGDGNATTSTINTPYSVGFSDQVDIEIDGAAGKIRVPRAMLPPIHGGSGGLFNLKNIKTTDREITASAAISFVDAPKVRLDRVTGHIAIDGRVGSFTGECQPYDPATVPRRF